MKEMFIDLITYIHSRPCDVRGRGLCLVRVPAQHPDRVGAGAGAGRDGRPHHRARGRADHQAAGREQVQDTDGSGRPGTAAQVV